MTASAVLVTAFIEAFPGKEEALAQALDTLCAATRREPGCITFQAMRVRGQPGRFVLWEHFADQEAFNTHLRLEHTEAYFARGLARETTPLRHDPLTV